MHVVPGQPNVWCLCSDGTDRKRCVNGSLAFSSRLRGRVVDKCWKLESMLKKATRQSHWSILACSFCILACNFKLRPEHMLAPVKDLQVSKHPRDPHPATNSQCLTTVRGNMGLALHAPCTAQYCATTARQLQSVQFSQTEWSQAAYNNGEAVWLMALTAWHNWLWAASVYRPTTHSFNNSWAVWWVT